MANRSTPPLLTPIVREGPRALRPAWHCQLGNVRTTRPHHRSGDRTTPGAIASATVVGPDLAYADVYATTVFVKGEDGLQWLLAARLGAEHITATNSGHNIYLYSPQLVIDAIRNVVAQVREPGAVPS